LSSKPGFIIQRWPVIDHIASFNRQKIPVFALGGELSRSTAQIGFCQLKQIFPGDSARLILAFQP